MWNGPKQEVWIGSKKEEVCGVEEVWSGSKQEEVRGVVLRLSRCSFSFQQDVQQFCAFTELNHLSIIPPQMLT